MCPGFLFSILDSHTSSENSTHVKRTTTGGACKIISLPVSFLMFLFVCSTTRGGILRGVRDGRLWAAARAAKERGTVALRYTYLVFLHQTMYRRAEAVLEELHGEGLRAKLLLALRWARVDARVKPRRGGHVACAVCALDEPASPMCGVRTSRQRESGCVEGSYSTQGEHHLGAGRAPDQTRGELFFSIETRGGSLSF